MRCEDAISRIADNLDEDHGQSDESELREHLMQCSSCRYEFEQFQKFWLELGSIPVPVHDGLVTKAALMAALKWRSNVRAALKAVAAIVIFAGIAVAAGILLKPGPAKVLAHVRGESGAPIELVEYGDYECPPCYAHGYHLMIDRLLEKYPGVIRYEFRHFPLTSIHPNALPAALAAEAAGVHGKFWEMHRSLLESHDRWSRNPKAGDVFVDLATEIGLDPAIFKKSLHSSELEQRILEETSKARDSGINATPTFLLNGRKLNPAPITFDDFDGQIRELLGTLKIEKSKGPK